MIELLDILSQPGGYDVAWDYCYENDLCMCADVNVPLWLVSGFVRFVNSGRGIRYSLITNTPGPRRSYSGSNYRSACSRSLRGHTSRVY